MKLAVDSQWHGVTYVHARTRQFTKAASLCGKKDFRTYNEAGESVTEQQAIASYLESGNAQRVAI